MSIVSKFSDTDQQKTEKAGTQLHEAGTRYGGEVSQARMLVPAIGGQSMDQTQQPTLPQQR